MIIIDDPNHSMIPIVLRELMKRKPMLPLKWIKIFYEDYTQTRFGGGNSEDDIILYNCFISKKRNSSSYVVSFGVEDTTNEGNKIIENINNIRGFMYEPTSKTTTGHITRIHHLALQTEKEKQRNQPKLKERIQSVVK